MSGAARGRHARVSPVQRHPWVIADFASLSACFWLSLWAGLEGQWLAFGVLVFGFACAAAGVFLWLKQTGQKPPQLRDYLTLVKPRDKLDP